MGKTPSIWGQRCSDHQKILFTKTRYFLAFEGEKTEKIYFEGFKKEIEGKLIEIIICPHQKNRSHPTHVLDYFSKQLDERGYNKDDQDEAGMIVDRDCESFTEEQYMNVTSECEKKGIQLYITNPRFEFWLLLHFLSKNQMDLEKICDPHKHYIEDCLCQKYPEFAKSQYDFSYFKDRIQTAIKNEKDFCENLDQLKDNIGCNIGYLMNKLMD